MMCRVGSSGCHVQVPRWVPQSSGQYTTEYLKALREGVERFQAAFQSWMETQHETDRGFMPGLVERVFTREDADPAKVARLELEVGEAAGLAAKAVQVTGAYMMVQGFGGPVDPISNWRNMTMPKAWLTPGEVLATCAAIKGRLDALEIDAQHGQDRGRPDFGPTELHEVIWTAAAPFWTNHQYRVAVREAAEALNIFWKQRLGRMNVDDTSFWGQTLVADPPQPGLPRLRWPGDDQDKTVKSMREGLGNLAKGLNLSVRNVTTHTRSELTEQEALERLGSYSHLARLLDQCEPLFHPDDK